MRRGKSDDTVRAGGRFQEWLSAKRQSGKTDQGKVSKAREQRERTAPGARRVVFVGEETERAEQGQEEWQQKGIS